MKIRIMQVEQFKPDGKAIFETSQLMFVPGKSILDLSKKTNFDYQFIKLHEDNIGGVVLPVSQFTINSEEVAKYQLGVCKGIYVSLAENDPKKTVDDAIKELEGKDPLVDFVYIPYQYDTEDESKIKNIVKLALIFQSKGKFVVLSVNIKDKTNMKDLQEALSLLTYQISLQNIFLDGLIVEINLLEIQKSAHFSLKNISILRRALPARLKKVAVRVSKKEDLESIYELTKQKCATNWTFLCSVDDTAISPQELTMAATGIYF